MNTSLQALSDAGVAIWLDDLSRQRLATGNLAALIADYNVTGVTTNPTIFAAALASRDRYIPQLSGLAAVGVDADQAIRTLTTDDVRAACDVLAEVYTATAGRDGRVSIEVDPRLAFDTEATVTNALDLCATQQHAQAQTLSCSSPSAPPDLPSLRPPRPSRSVAAVLFASPAWCGRCRPTPTSASGEASPKTNGEPSSADDDAPAGPRRPRPHRQSIRTAACAPWMPPSTTSAPPPTPTHRALTWAHRGLGPTKGERIPELL